MRLAVLFRNALPKGSKDVLHPYIEENIVRLSKKKSKSGFKWITLSVPMHR